MGLNPPARTFPSAGIAGLAVALAFSWQWAAVHWAYQGNWTALFCAGDRFSRPPEIQYREYVFDGAGYDGQFSQVIAHDPLLARRYDGFIDEPRLRYRRILVPGLAYVLATEQPEKIDTAYIAAVWLFVALGTFCLAQLATDAGRSALWGLLFLITPATLTGLERMTVDIGLTALAVASLLTARRQSWLLLWSTLAAAMLSRETGVLVMIAVVVWLARQKNFRLAAALSTSLLPAAAWYLFVQARASGDYGTSGFSFFPFFAVLTPRLDTGAVALMIRIASAAAVIGALWAALRSVLLVLKNRFQDLDLLLCFLFAALLLLFQNESVWVDPNGFTRIYSPLLVCLIAATWNHGFGQTLASFAMVASPMCLQLGVHVAGPLLRSLAGR